MAEKSNKGFDYEDKIIKILKKKKLIPANKKELVDQIMQTLLSISKVMKSLLNLKIKIKALTMDKKNLYGALTSFGVGH